MSWTQPVCWDCWFEAKPGIEPTRLRDPDEELCCKCGKMTKSGIYIRVDPTKVPYPRKEKDDD